jgi:hypothetical protein
MAATPPSTTITTAQRTAATITVGPYTISYDSTLDSTKRVLMTGPGVGNPIMNMALVQGDWTTLLAMQAAINDFVAKVTAAMPNGQTP